MGSWWSWMPNLAGRVQRPWSAWRRLSWSERKLALTAWCLLPAFAIGLRVVGLRRLHGRLAQLTAARSNPDPVPGVPPDKVVLAVERAASRLPVVTTCLVRSLVVWYLLARRGQRPQLVIGVRRPGPALEAHAWVEVDGRPVNDTTDVRERFVAFDQAIVPGTWL
jgi:hypothetical protein